MFITCFGLFDAQYASITFKICASSLCDNARLFPRGAVPSARQSRCGGKGRIQVALHPPLLLVLVECVGEGETFRLCSSGEVGDVRERLFVGRV